MGGIALKNDLVMLSTRKKMQGKGLIVGDKKTIQNMLKSIDKWLPKDMVWLGHAAICSLCDDSSSFMIVLITDLDKEHNELFQLDSQEIKFLSWQEEDGVIFIGKRIGQELYFQGKKIRIVSRFNYPDK